MSDKLIFDAGKAESLQKTLLNKDKEIRITLDRIKRLVEKSVKENWTGASAQAFNDLYAASSNNIVDYLNSWLECSNELLGQAARAKEANEQAEKDIINREKNRISTPKKATA